MICLVTYRQSISLWLDGPEDGVVRELHRLECAQADLLVSHLGPLSTQDRVLDAGSGRGGCSFVANQRFGWAEHWKDSHRA